MLTLEGRRTVQWLYLQIGCTRPVKEQEFLLRVLEGSLEQSLSRSAVEGAEPGEEARREAAGADRSPEGFVTLLGCLLAR